MSLTCERCGNKFQKTNKRGPTPKYCSDTCRKADHRTRTDAPSNGTRGLTLRDVVNVAQLDLSVKQCDVILEAFTKARMKAARRERESA